MADVAEDAQSHSYDWWEMMTSLRQTMLNLMAAGLFHLVEQQLAALSRDGMFDAPVKDTKLSVIARWYRENLGIDLASMPSWGTVDEMRLIAASTIPSRSWTAWTCTPASPARCRFRLLAPFSSSLCDRQATPSPEHVQPESLEFKGQRWYAGPSSQSVPR
jgi:hypothetical protein